jgi:hypothetical protein
LAQDVRKRRIRDALLFALLALLVVSPWLLRNIYYTRNPLWPYFSSVFGLGTWTATDLHNFLWEQTSHGMGKSLVSLLKLPFNLTFHTVEFDEYPPFPFSVLYVFILPLTLIVTSRDKRLRPLLVLVIAYTLFWFFTVQIARYIVLVLPFLSLLTAMAAYEVVCRLPARPRVVAGVNLAAIVAVFLAAWLQIRAYPKIQWSDVPVSHAQRDAFLQARVAPYAFYQLLNRQYKSQYSVYALGGGTAYFADGTMLGDWFGPYRYARIFDRLSDPQALYQELKAMNAGFFEVHVSDVGEDRGDLLLEQSLSRSHLKLIYAVPGVLGFKVLDIPANSRGTEILQEPGFLPASGKTSGGWTVVGQPLVSSSGSDAYQGEPALRSDFYNFMRQRVPVQPEHIYLLTHWSRWARRNSSVRLQVSWLDQRRKLLEVNIRNVAAGPMWQPHRMAVTAPKTAYWADVYAGVAGNNDVAWFAHVSFKDLQADSSDAATASGEKLVSPGVER